MRHRTLLAVYHPAFTPHGMHTSCNGRRTPYSQTDVLRAHTGCQRSRHARRCIFFFLALPGGCRLAGMCTWGPTGDRDDVP
eukprot:1239724-Prymnesium_polylepis.1